MLWNILWSADNFWKAGRGEGGGGGGKLSSWGVELGFVFFSGYSGIEFMTAKTIENGIEIGATQAGISGM